MSDYGRKFGPLYADQPLVTDNHECPGCNQPIQTGQYVALVNIGPGADREQQAKARDGRPYTAVALPAHWTCVTGEPT